MAARILVIDDDIETVRLVGLTLERRGHLVRPAADGPEGLALARKEKPDLIILDIMMPDMDGYEVARRLRNDPVTADRPILMFTAKSQVDDQLAGFEAGADEVLTKPTLPSEFAARVEALLQRAGSVVEGATARERSSAGFAIGVLSARGGAGVSAVSLNLATALESRFSKDVVLAEFTPGQATFGMDLGLSADAGARGLLEADLADLTIPKVRDALTSHASGLRILLAPENPSDVELASRAEHFAMILGHLTTLARFVVLDLGAGLPTLVQRLLPSCDICIIVTEAAHNSVRQARMLVDELLKRGIDRHRILPVLNYRSQSDSQLARTEAQEQLGLSLAATLAPAPELFARAVHSQKPAILCEPEDLTSQQFLKLADLVTARESAR